MTVEGSYRPLHPVQRAYERTGSSTSSLDEEEHPAFERRTGWWWWQRGPATRCCFCFSLRAGIWLLAANALLAAFANIFKESVFVWITQPAIDAEREKMLVSIVANLSYVLKHMCYVLMHRIFIVLAWKRIFAGYDRMCTGVLILEACGNLLRDIDHLEGLMEWAITYAPLYDFIGALLFCFSLVGFRAAYTGSAKMAKYFMMIYPLLLVVDIVEVTVSPSLKPAISRASTCVNVYLCVYYFKVVWSFYIRNKIAEARRLSAEAVSKGRAINPPGARTVVIV